MGPEPAAALWFCSGVLGGRADSSEKLRDGASERPGSCGGDARVAGAASRGCWPTRAKGRERKASGRQALHTFNVGGMVAEC